MSYFHVASGDLASNYPSPIVVGISGIYISGNPPLDNQALTYSAANNTLNYQFIGGFTSKSSCLLATTTALPANTYLNGANGVGATLTGVTPGVLSIDGVAVTLNTRVLIKNEAAPANNGIYLVTATGSVGVYLLTRATDFDQSAEVPGAFVPVELGNTLAGTIWLVAGSGPFTIGTTAINFTQTGSPSGTAGGDLTGSYPNPTVAKVSGVPFYTNPASGNFLQSNGTTFNSVQLQGDVIASGTPGNYTGNLIVNGIAGNPLVISDVGLNMWPTYAPVGTTAGPASGAPLFMFLGIATTNATLNNLFINMELTIVASGVPNSVEVGLFSTPQPPNRGLGGNPTFTKLASTATFDSVTAGATKGVKNTGAPLSIVVSGGMPLWVGIRTAFATAQPTFTATGGEVGLRFTEKVTLSVPFASGTTFTSNGPSNTGIYAVVTNF